jgi:hypothetical protein
MQEVFMGIETAGPNQKDLVTDLKGGKSKPESKPESWSTAMPFKKQQPEATAKPVEDDPLAEILDEDLPKAPDPAMAKKSEERDTELKKFDQPVKVDYRNEPPKPELSTEDRLRMAGEAKAAEANFDVKPLNEQVASPAPLPSPDSSLHSATATTPNPEVLRSVMQHGSESRPTKTKKPWWKFW